MFQSLLYSPTCYDAKYYLVNPEQVVALLHFEITNGYPVLQHFSPSAFNFNVCSV